MSKGPGNKVIQSPARGHFGLSAPLGSTLHPLRKETTKLFNYHCSAFHVRFCYKQSENRLLKRPCRNIRIPSHDHILTENITCEQKIKFVSNQERYLKKPIISAEKIAWWLQSISVNLLKTWFLLAIDFFLFFFSRKVMLNKANRFVRFWKQLNVNDVLTIQKFGEERRLIFRSAADHRAKIFSNLKNTA